MESQAMKTTSMQDSAYQALSAQKNPRKKSGLFETTSARKSKRDKEALQKTIVKLEAELKRYEEHHKPAQGQESEVTCSVEERQPLRGEVSLDGLEGMCKNELAYMRSRSDMNKLEEESKGKQQQMVKDSLLVEMEELKAQLQRIQNNEEKQAQMTKMKQSKLVLEMEELKSQLEETKERERQKVSVLENEKDACLKEIAEMKTCIEKMSTENSSLMEKMKALENRSSCCCLASVVHGNAEILTISHHSTFSVDAESPHCFNSCGGATCNSGTQSSKCVAGTSSVEDDEIRMKEMYKQLKRERNLLLDVMLLMYTRRWFLEEAIPYIRRTLRKCGVNSEDRNWNSDLLSSQNTGFNVIAHSRVCSCFRRFVYTAIRQAWLVHVGLWGSGIRGCLIVMETFGLWLQPELWDPSTSQGPRASVPAKCLCQN
ncbi:uncharacterized protein LOC115649174 isoform X4 [Gopherus evgoodei]|uniref:uncharacterized protein LOC115649174 isoform X4 n=1 Tax=Gopherus evgoodei TaxID=1825980 RepID=UPI0011CFBFC8|nr:uncharacterized protein LOC115649174 isoform X4 [Gopherus evgoodei]